MDWERISKALLQFFLMLVEYSFKLCAVIAAFIVLGTPGNFNTKFLAGFESLSQGLRKLVAIPPDIMEISVLIKAYNTQTAADFTATYGADTLNALLVKINGLTAYLLEVSSNFSRSPLVTLSASLLVFLSFYVLGWVIRFARQQGQGSLLVRMERKLGDKIFSQPTLRRRKKEKKTVQRTNSSPSQRKRKKRNPNHVQRQVNRKKNVDPQTLKYLIESSRSS